MYQPQIISEAREGSSARLRLRIAPELAYFAVHFPSWPILPGVVQVHWAIEFARRCFDERGAFQGMENLKFYRVVGPGTDLDLTLSYDAGKTRFEFSYESAGTKYSSGRVVFSAAP